MLHEEWALRPPCRQAPLVLRRGAVAHRITHRHTFTSLHAISKRPLLLAQASAYLAFVATRSDRTSWRPSELFSVPSACCSIAAPLRHAENWVRTRIYSSASLGSLWVAVRVGLRVHSFICFPSCCVLVLIGYWNNTQYATGCKN